MLFTNTRYDVLPGDLNVFFSIFFFAFNKEAAYKEEIRAKSQQSVSKKYTYSSFVFAFLLLLSFISFFFYSPLNFLCLYLRQS
jgi:hypothetical protein